MKNLNFQNRVLFSLKKTFKIMQNLKIFKIMYISNTTFEIWKLPKTMHFFIFFSIYSSNFDLYFFHEQHVSHNRERTFLQIPFTWQVHAVACTHTRVQVQGYESIGGETRRKSYTWFRGGFKRDEINGR